MKRIIYIIPVLLLLLSCEKKEPVTDYIVTNAGESFDIELKANHVAGYQWVWINRDNVEVADTTGLRYIVDDPATDGSPGTEIWTFKAKSAGEDTLIFVYQTQWSSGYEPESRKIRVSVSD